MMKTIDIQGQKRRFVLRYQGRCRSKLLQNLDTKKRINFLQKQIWFFFDH